MDDIFGDPDELLELYERGKAARGSSRLDAVLEEAEPEPEEAEGGDEEEAEARQEAYAQRQARNLSTLNPGPYQAAEPRVTLEVYWGGGTGCKWPCVSTWLGDGMRSRAPRLLSAAGHHTHAGCLQGWV